MAAAEAVSVFSKVAGVPTVAAARLSPADNNGLVEVEARWSQRELERGKTVSFSKSYFVRKKGDEELEVVCATSFSADTSQVLKVAYASKCPVRAVLVKDKTAKAEPASEAQQYIEVWNGDKLLKTVDVKALKKHGKIHEDVHFGSFQLCSDGSNLLYIAEREKPKSESYFKKDLPVTPGDDTTPTEKGSEFIYDPSWGEQLTSVVNPVPVVIDIVTEECTVVDVSKIGDISAAQVQWVPGGEGDIVFIGYENKPMKLGFVYCFNRRSALYHVNILSGSHACLTDKDHTLFSPRFNPQGTKLAFFESPGYGPHRCAAALKMINWSDKVVTTVIAAVNTPHPPLNFPGFFTNSLPDRCWDERGRLLVFSTQWGSFQDVTIVQTESSKVSRICDNSRMGTWLVLDVSCDLVLAKFSNPNTTHKLFVGFIPKLEDKGQINWTLVASHSDPAFTKDLKWDLLTFHPTRGESIQYEALLLQGPPRSAGAKPPLVVFPHGGPHGVYTADFLAWPACLNLLGYSVLLVNYRGSTGFGQATINCLLGNVGTQDVLDVQEAAVHVVDRGLVDKEKVVVMGGSHGGFLTIHLLGQFPDFYKAGCALNPVTCMPSLSLSSDIPDWSYVEPGLNFDPSVPPTAEVFAKMLSASPITHATKIKAPLLFAIGGKDLRCPPSQSLSLYNILKANGKETKLLLYPEDCHPISSVFSNADAFVNTVVWFHRYAL